MSKRQGHTARIAALEKEVRQLRAGIRRDIIHAVRREVDLRRPPDIIFHQLGSDSYSEHA